MHPNMFLRAFWRNTVKPEVFVAMSFDSRYDERFEIIKAAVHDVPYDGERLRAHRVDLSKTGDSILTDINDGIAHSALVLADVSTVHRDADKKVYRNANVLYEVGVALACRQPSEVLVIRDDDDQLLFDVSTVPTMRLDFTDPTAAQGKLTEELMNRLREVERVQDARVLRAVARLMSSDRRYLSVFLKYGRNSFGLEAETYAAYDSMARLVDNELIEVVGTRQGKTRYRYTPIGYAIAQNIDALLPSG